MDPDFRRDDTLGYMKVMRFLSAPIERFRHLVQQASRTLADTATRDRKAAINAERLGLLPLAEIDRVTFYKRDELATDLICCDVEIRGQTWFFHEELDGWDLLLQHLQKLPGFRSDWYSAVSQPPFAPCETVAFSRE